MNSQALLHCSQCDSEDYGTRLKTLGFNHLSTCNILTVSSLKINLNLFKATNQLLYSKNKKVLEYMYTFALTPSVMCDTSTSSKWCRLYFTNINIATLWKANRFKHHLKADLAHLRELTNFSAGILQGVTQLADIHLNCQLQ